MTLKDLVLVHKDAGTAWYRTKDGRFDVLGDDLNTRPGRGGAGPVWSFRPRKTTREWTNDTESFAFKKDCLDALIYTYIRALGRTS